MNRRTSDVGRTQSAHSAHGAGSRTIAQLLARRAELEPYSDSATLDVELLLSHCLNKPRSYLRAWPEKALTEAELEAFQQLFQRRLAGEPVAYLIGSQGFWTLELAVNSSTLIPRPETELLVETALAYGNDLARAKVLDLGTGSGAIALALASERPAWQLLGCDRQAEAVALAEQNRQHCRLDNARFIESDWFAAIEPQAFDLIVSNPPYIDPVDKHLDEGDVRFEPLSALVADNKGLADIEQIACLAPAYLNSAGGLLLEHGYDQGKAVREILEAAGFSQVKTYQDLAGQDRVTTGRKL